jgi:hypothetical protein
MTALVNERGASLAMTPAGSRSTRPVTFRLAPDFGARVAEVAGDFSAWSPVAMIGDVSNGFWIELELDPGRRWRYRFLLDGERWVNDPAAPLFVTGPNGAPTSAIDT